MLSLCYQRRKRPSMDSTFPLVPIANFGACLLIFLSTSKNMFQSWNVGACSFAIWIAIMGFHIGLDSIIWSNSTANISPVWCDISEYSISFKECLVLITRRDQRPILKMVRMQLSLPHRSWSSEDYISWFAGATILHLRETWVNYSVCHEIFIAKYVQRIELLFDLFLCIGLPVIQMILSESIKVDWYHRLWHILKPILCKRTVWRYSRSSVALTNAVPSDWWFYWTTLCNWYSH